MKKMQLDIDIEPTLRFPGMTSIEKQMDQSENKVLVYLLGYKHLPNLHFCFRQTDRHTDSGDLSHTRPCG